MMKSANNLLLSVFLVAVCFQSASAFIPADFEQDNEVDLRDFSIFAKAWGTCPSDPNWDPACDVCKLSCNTIDEADLDFFGKCWLVSLTDPNMSFIPGGSFRMGDSFNEGAWYERPVHTVSIDSFCMGRWVITNGQYCDFLNSAMQQDLVTISEGIVYKADSGKAYPYCDISNYCPDSQITFSNGVFIPHIKNARNMSDDPAVMVSWYGAVAYCNWRSLQEEKEPCYNLSSWTCDFTKKGYRLPTEAKWEYAARGSFSEKRFPSGDTITQTNTNFYSYPFFYDESPYKNIFHPAWNDGVYPYTSPVGTFAPNGFGLYDMSGNVWQWCNDRFSETYYASCPENNPTGPVSGSDRILRGGSWYCTADRCRVADRHFLHPFLRSSCFGFRICINY